MSFSAVENAGRIFTRVDQHLPVAKTDLMRDRRGHSEQAKSDKLRASICGAEFSGYGRSAEVGQIAWEISMGMELLAEIVQALGIGVLVVLNGVYPWSSGGSFAAVGVVCAVTLALQFY